MNGEQRSGRETRLLILVIVVALAVLFVLARFRFPATGLTAVPPSPGPLERLAARAAYDDLSSAISTVVQRVAKSVVIVQIEAAPEKEKEKEKEKPAADKVPPPATTPPAALATRLVPAVRVRSDLALLHVPRGMQVSAAQGFFGPTGVVAVDERREIALVRVTRLNESVVGLPAAFEGFAGYSYVALIEAAIGGPTARPVFIGRLDASIDDRWAPPPLLIGGASEATPGSLVFAIDGRLIGMAMPHLGAMSIVPASALDAAVVELGGGGGL